MEYVTIQGDTWDLIAYKLLGSESRMRGIMEANPELMWTFVFPAGVLLSIPEDQSTDAPIDLPPWKRVPA